MPEPLRRRTFIVVSKNSPFYVDRLPADEQARDAQSYRDSLAIWRAAGYRAATYTDDFTANDYGDRAHLAVSGGRKLAALVADNVRAQAAELGYLPPPRHDPPPASPRPSAALARRVASHALSLGAGVLAALILHYVLYRIDLPSKPFIYVAF